MIALDEILFNALRYDAVLMEDVGGRIVSTCFEVGPDEVDNTPLPCIIVMDDGLQNNPDTKDCEWEAYEDRVTASVEVDAESPKAVKALIRFLSPLCFSVYLVQVQPYFWNYYLKGRYSAIARLAPLPAMGKVLLTALLLYLFCLAVDLLRALLFRILSVRKLAAWLTDIFLVQFRATTGLKGDA